MESHWEEDGYGTSWEKPTFLPFASYNFCMDLQNDGGGGEVRGHLAEVLTLVPRTFRQSTGGPPAV